MGVTAVAAMNLERFIRSSHKDPLSKGWSKCQGTDKPVYIEEGLRLILDETGIGVFNAKDGRVIFKATINSSVVTLSNMPDFPHQIDIGPGVKNSEQAAKAINDILRRIPCGLRAGILTSV